MNKIVIIENNGNEIIYQNSNDLDGIDVYFMNGDNNVVTIEKPYTINSLKILIDGNGNSVRIGANCEIRKAIVQLNLGNDNRKLIIDKYAFIGDVVFQLWNTGSSISIGEDCLFSSDIVIQTDDGFAIYDIDSKEIVNDTDSVIIENHVWLGYGNFICGGARIPSNTIVGARSVVCDKYDGEFLVLAGNPAKILKQGVNFSKYTIKNFKNLR